MYGVSGIIMGVSGKLKSKMKVSGNGKAGRKAERISQKAGR